MCVHRIKLIQSSEPDFYVLTTLFFHYGVSFKNIYNNIKDNVNENDYIINWHFYVNNISV